MTDIRKLDLNLLVTLDTLLAERNVTHAAKRLNLSQPAISTRLTRLRDLLGDPLLLPAQRGMIPTERALELQEPLHQALEGVRRVVAENSPFDPSTITATIAIAASDYVQYAILMPLLDVLRRDAPGIKVAWRTIDTSMLDTQMARGDVSLALSTPQTAPETLRMRKIYREEYVAIARCDHPAIDRSLDLDSFCALDHVIVSPEGGGFEGPADDALAALGRKRNVALSAPGFLVVPEIVARSDMIALVPSRVAKGRTGQIRMFDPPMPVTGFDMALIWHDRTTTHPLHRWLRDRITALIANASAD
ncbi:MULTISPECIES: LysR family transcriptional regulator [Thalassospira]|uniref:LysR family transcriptional regulator n=1 Tax=Thalassospira profundimaris TaxID=502049 RepID=A0A367VAY2_9PROT|nr:MULTISPECIES: LysR family transcriptional regulator [Thalassospira]KZB71874.1 LysR family transcriptional regulator [Thalassospira sp. MCCC 1A01148]RCK22375.1 LysR family transcriptional regulator [Thalassospira profundimaris]